MDRRRLLQTLLTAGIGAALPRTAVRGAPPARFDGEPFSLGVASGYPSESGVVLWTRLAPRPLSPDGGMAPAYCDVEWEVSADESFRQVVARGIEVAAPDWAHSVHAVARGLQPQRPYWYRFTSGGARSPVGRFATTPARATAAASLELAVVCCQNWEQGQYAAYRDIANRSPDLTLHLGDYIYEYGPNPQAPRQHATEEILTLADYRIRYAQYKTDASLQAAHAANAWLVTWDDHEVENDYVGDRAPWDEDPVRFLARRTAAYRAWFEHQPVPPSMAPRGGRMAIWSRTDYGQLATLCMLDQRQFRDRTARPQQMLGAGQEQWFGGQLHGNASLWNLIGQGTMVSHLLERRDGEVGYSRDSWNGFPEARRRFVRSLQQSRARNPVILTGDIHAFAAGHLTATPEDPSSAVVAPEFVTTGISSNARPQRVLDGWLELNPNIRYGLGERRGYMRVHLDRDRLALDMVAVDDHRDLASACRPVRSFVVEAGRPGMVDDAH